MELKWFVNFALPETTPVLMLTARDAEADVVAGLDVGADELLVKPFPFSVLLARLRDSRRASNPVAKSLHVRDLTLDQGSREVHRAECPINSNGISTLLTQGSECHCRS